MIRKMPFVIIIITFLNLLYVYQQIELYKVSYEIKNKEKILESFVDQNQFLKYNVSNLKSPDRIEKCMLAKNINMELVEDVELLKFKVGKKHFASSDAGARGKFAKIFDDIFSIKRIAMADSENKQQKYLPSD